MANLTPLSKGLIGLAVVGVMASAVWHLLLKPQPTDQQAGFPPAHAAALPNQKATALTPAQSLEYAEAGRKLINKGDFEQARAHLELAVQSGNPSAACLLGEMTLKGQGGLRASREQAASLFQFAQSHNTICFSTSQ
jgi:hypothetical protein